MAGLVLIGLILVLVIFIVISKNRKRAIVISLVVIGLYHLYVVNTCGPNSADVKVMKPMAQKIADYIVAHGIPKSLKDIPDLPYMVEGCAYQQSNLEKCFYYKNNKTYEIEMYVLGSLDIEIYCKKTETGLRYKLDKNISSNQWFIAESDISFSSKITGICNPMKQ